MMDAMERALTWLLQHHTSGRVVIYPEELEELRGIGARVKATDDGVIVATLRTEKELEQEAKG